MIPPPPRSTRTYTLFPYTTLFRAYCASAASRGERPGGVADDRRSRRHVLSHNRAHADDRPGADAQRGLGLSLTDQCSGTDVDAVLDVNITVAPHRRREGDEIANHTVMLDIGIEIGMEMASDPDVAGERHDRRYQCARPDLYLIHPNAIGGGHAEEIEPGVCALQHYSSPRQIGRAHV